MVVPMAGRRALPDPVNSTCRLIVVAEPARRLARFALSVDRSAWPHRHPLHDAAVDNMIGRADRRARRCLA
jgi:hypothetical protein